MEPDEFNILTETRYGRMLYNRNDVYIGRSMELYGEFSYGESRLFESILKPGMNVVEVGANIGSHTIPIAKAAGPQGLVHVFEPQRLVFQALCANVALNQLTNVVPHYAASGEEEGTLLVPELEPKARNNFGGLGLGDFDTGRKVPVVPIDTLDLPACHFIKADVEGMEESVLRGAEKTISRFRPVLYVENDRREKSVSLIRYIDSLGYRIYDHRPPLFHAENFKGNSENVFPKIVSRNLFCVHRSTPSNITGFREVVPPKEEDGS